MPDPIMLRVTHCDHLDLITHSIKSDLLKCKLSRISHYTTRIKYKCKVQYV